MARASPGHLRPVTRARLSAGSRASIFRLTTRTAAGAGSSATRALPVAPGDARDARLVTRCTVRAPTRRNLAHASPRQQTRTTAAPVGTSAPQGSRARAVRAGRRRVRPASRGARRSTTRRDPRAASISRRRSAPAGRAPGSATRCCTAPASVSMVSASGPLVPKPWAARCGRGCPGRGPRRALATRRGA